MIKILSVYKTILRSQKNPQVIYFQDKDSLLKIGEPTHAIWSFSVLLLIFFSIHFLVKSLDYINSYNKFNLKIMLN